MNKYFCDRCHGEIYGERSKMQVSGPVISLIPNQDLCNSCAKKLQEFMKNG